MRKSRFFLLFLLFRTLYAEDIETPSFFSTESFQKAHVGFCFVDLKTDQEVISFNPGKYFIPASLQKVIISAAALRFLGEEFQFTTALEYEGSVSEEGELAGNLWIRGGGDPTLMADIFTIWDSAIKKAGIIKVDGKICIDVSCFEQAMASPHWEYCDLGNYYGAGASALSINENHYKLTFKPGAKLGHSVEVVKLDPPVSFLTFYNEVKTGPSGSGDLVFVYGSEYSDVQFYRGTIPMDAPTFTVKAAIPDPPFLCGLLLSEKIPATRGIEIVRKRGNEETTPLLIHSSPKLKEILYKMNHSSINLYAEHLLKAMGSGSSEQGLSRIRTWLKEEGLSAQIYDGAGIARKDLITPRSFTKLLCSLKKNQTFVDSLTEPGQKGTLKRFAPLSRGKMKAKDGTLSDVYNLSGYLTLACGRELAFSVFCNNYEGPQSEIKAELEKFLLYIEAILECPSAQKG